MAGLRQVPSGLNNPALDGFLRDVREALIKGIPQSTVDGIIKQARDTSTTTVQDIFKKKFGNFETSSIEDIVDAVIKSVKEDPFYIFLGERIDVINGPESLPASFRGQLAAVNTQLQAGIDANGSAIVTLQNTTSDQAIQITALGTRVGSAESSIVTLNGTTATQAAQITTLNSNVSGNTASIQTLTTVTNGLAAQYSVKLDVNGRVSGFGLYNSGSSSKFYIRADKFAVGDSSAGDAVPFVVESGVVYIDTTLIKNGAIANAKIGNYIASTNYNGSLDYPNTSPGTAGWCINKTGDAVFNTVLVRNGSNIGNGALVQSGTMSNSASNSFSSSGSSSLVLSAYSVKTTAGKTAGFFFSLNLDATSVAKQITVTFSGAISYTWTAYYKGNQTLDTHFFAASVAYNGTIASGTLYATVTCVYGAPSGGSGSWGDAQLSILEITG